MIRMEGVVALVVCAFCWSLGGVFLKHVEVNSFAAAGFRSLFAFITLMIFSKRFPRVKIFNIDDDARRSKIVNRKATLYLWLGALTYSATMILFCIANKLTYSANAVFLQYTFPVWIIIFGPIILKEKNTKIDYIAILGVIVGMLLFFAENLFGSNQSADGKFKDTEFLGNILALISGITFAGTTIFQRKQSITSPMDNTSFDSFMLAQLITAIFGLPFVFFAPNGFPDIKSLVFLILLGVVQMGFANFAYSLGIKKVPAFSASLITMIEPLMNPVWVLIFVHELPGLWCILGGVLIIACIILREVVNKRK
ncbi:DMT family transporter [Treponema sp.]|uniref:DMT family transporter n=1 Tax=Treponema sp. TaxID=166 RepID=UPI00298E6E53|nr:DMT family transporter [Treponema sp.]MCR5613967.1 DMT family transporter [Treponema sp.]